MKETKYSRLINPILLLRYQVGYAFNIIAVINYFLDKFTYFNVGITKSKKKKIGVSWIGTLDLEVASPRS